jgi:hypothetical protein
VSNPQVSTPLVDEVSTPLVGGSPFSKAHPQKWLFVAGHHKSGTTLLQSILRQHPLITGFKDTGVPADEGQHLQTVIKPARRFGGPGRYIFDLRSYMDENNPLATPENADLLLAQWSQYYDTTKPIFLEKSPPNLIRTRFLQALFPQSAFIVILRHPLAIAYATQKACEAPLEVLLAHTLLGYDIFRRDKPHLRHCHVVRYEDLVSHHQVEMQRIETFLGLESHSYSFPSMANKDHHYFSFWEQEKEDISSRQRKYLTTHIEERANHYGYSLNSDHYYIGQSSALDGQ